MDCMVFLVLMAIRFYPGKGCYQGGVSSSPKMISRAECLSESQPPKCDSEAVIWYERNLLRQ
jgi:hypothetical protein